MLTDSMPEVPLLSGRVKSHTIPSIHILIPWRDGVDALASQCNMSQRRKNHSATRTRARVARVRAGHPNQLDYSGRCIHFDHGPLQQLFRDEHMPVLSKHVCTRTRSRETLSRWTGRIVPILSDDPRRGSEMKKDFPRRIVVAEPDKLLSA